MPNPKPMLRKILIGSALLVAWPASALALCTKIVTTPLGVSTKLALDANPGPGDGFSRELGELNGDLYYVDPATDRLSRYSSGTVTTIDPSAGITRMGSFYNFQGRLYFRGYHPSLGWALFSTQGTSIDLVVDLLPGAKEHPINPKLPIVSSYTPYQGKLAFSILGYEPNNFRRHLAMLDPSSATMTFPFQGHPTYENLLPDDGFAVVNGRLIARAFLVDSSLGMMVLDGTQVSVMLVSPQLGVPFFSGPMAVLNNEVYYVLLQLDGSQPPVPVSGLWKTDGVTVPVQVAQFPSDGQVGWQDITDVQALNGQIHVVTALAIRRFTGTSMQPLPLHGIDRVSTPVEPISLGMIHGFVFGGHKENHGYEPYIAQFNGPPILIDDIEPGAMSSMFGAPVQVGSTVYFTAHSAATGRELWSFTERPQAYFVDLRLCPVFLPELGWDWEALTRSLPVSIETHLVGVGGPIDRVARFETEIGPQQRYEPLRIHTAEAASLPLAHAFVSIIRNRETGGVISTPVADHGLEGTEGFAGFESIIESLR